MSFFSSGSYQCLKYLTKTVSPINLNIFLDSQYYRKEKLQNSLRRTVKIRSSLKLNFDLFFLKIFSIIKYLMTLFF
jgi:hypothetical protein